MIWSLVCPSLHSRCLPWWAGTHKVFRQALCSCATSRLSLGFALSACTSLANTTAPLVQHPQLNASPAPMCPALGSWPIPLCRTFLVLTNSATLCASPHIAPASTLASGSAQGREIGAEDQPNLHMLASKLEFKTQQYDAACDHIDTPLASATSCTSRHHPFSWSSSAAGAQ